MIIGVDLVRVIDDIGEAVTACLFNADPEPDTAAPGFQIIANPLRSRFGQ